MTNQERLQANNAKIEAIQDALKNKVGTSGEIEIVENGKHDVSKYASANVNVQPNLATKEITQNGTYNASDDGVDGYSSVDVNVPTPDLSQTTATADDVLEDKEFFNASGEKVAGTYKDMLQGKIDGDNSCEKLFYEWKGTSLDFIKNLDTSNVTTMRTMFYSCNRITKLALPFNTSNVTTMQAMFCNCYELKTLELSFDTSNVQHMGEMFKDCRKLTSPIVLNTGSVTNTYNMFNICTQLTTISLSDLSNVTSASGMFDYCTNLTNLTLKNIKISLTIGSGTSWGHLLTLDSLLNTIKELHTNTGTTTKKLTMGTANTAKLADVYVKLIDITDEMRAEDEYIDNKAPFEVCESTDEGAMLVTEYVTTVKKWSLA